MRLCLNAVFVVEGNVKNTTSTNDEKWRRNKNRWLLSNILMRMRRTITGFDIKLALHGQYLRQYMALYFVQY